MNFTSGRISSHSSGVIFDGLFQAADCAFISDIFIAQELATDTEAWIGEFHPVEVESEVTRCQVIAEVPAVLWLILTSRSPIRMPMALSGDGEPNPQPLKKLAASTAA
ncbi:hypothetical protein F3I62_03570 [Pseudomonas sp. R-28-1W-6]|uniref:hypothetical protein n=1 Tax=Pseudomonas sp. R-28-1W-6 TaxID=2650101 RepID=UPI001365AA20|nr:hypothetical protein [Pseudomonas sp. R-28-1W-6]MWV11167.1 hypothetical protein [Pseudomonas sp. R-28-1W-6]